MELAKSTPSSRYYRRNNGDRFRIVMRTVKAGTKITVQAWNLSTGYSDSKSHTYADCVEALKKFWELGSMAEDAN